MNEHILSMYVCRVQTKKLAKLEDGQLTLSSIKVTDKNKVTSARVCIGREHWSSGYAKRLTSERPCVRIPVPLTKFLHLFILKIALMIEKRPGLAPLKKFVFTLVG